MAPVENSTVVKGTYVAPTLARLPIEATAFSNNPFGDQLNSPGTAFGNTGS